MRTCVLFFVLLHIANGQLIHQPAAPLPDEIRPDGNRRLLPVNDALPHAPKDALVGPPLSAYDPLRNIVDRVFTTTDLIIETSTVENTTKVLQYTLTALACASVVACGLLPALLLAPEAQLNASSFATRHLTSLLSFSVGSLLGDVFLHILPEAYAAMSSAGCTYSHIGLAIMAGLLICFLVEKCCAQTEESQHKAAAILNLVANLVDNFTHGLAVTSSFFVGVQFGLLTTLSILLHEIPHEISDFAILLRADFDRWSAVKAQLLTSLGGVFGALVALGANVCATGSASMAVILAFTAGGFVNIALVQVLPELQKEKMSLREAVQHICLVVLGIAVMAAVNMCHASQ